MKYEWRKQDKELYLPKDQPVSIVVSSFKFLMLDGQGNPNSPTFAEAVQVLYSLSYAIKMMPKNDITPEGYFEYTVFPLEGIWDLNEEGKREGSLDKDKLIYTLMIRQPDFVTAELAQRALEKTKKKQPQELLNNVRFGEVEEGLSVQMTHIGSYDNEPTSFVMMEEYCAKNGLKRKSKIHREIYISDARKTEIEKLNTVLRFRVENN